MLALSNGTSSLIYLDPGRESRRVRLQKYLQDQPWAGLVVDTEDLGTIGQAPLYGLAFAVSLKADETVNDYGVPGCSLIAVPRWDKRVRPGCGQHGGLGRYEQSPVLMIEGAGFSGGTRRFGTAHIVDLAPTILRHLGLPDGATDGRALQI